MLNWKVGKYELVLVGNMAVMSIVILVRPLIVILVP